MRYANYVRDVLITEPQIATPVTLATPLSAMIVNRHEIGVNSTETYLDDQLDVTAKVKTGFIQHAVVAGLEAGRETSDPARPTWTNVPTTSLLNPDPEQALSGTETITSRVTTTSLTAAAYVLDTMQLGSHWDLTGGIRWDRFATDYTQTLAPAAAFHRVDEMPSWRAAAGVQAGIVRKHLLRCWHVVQSIGGIAVAERVHREPAAGEEQDLRIRKQMGRDAEPVVIARRDFPNGEDQCARARSGQSAVERSGGQPAREWRQRCK